MVEAEKTRLFRKKEKIYLLTFIEKKNENYNYSTNYIYGVSSTWSSFDNLYSFAESNVDSLSSHITSLNFIILKELTFDILLASKNVIPITEKKIVKISKTYMFSVSMEQRARDVWNFDMILNYIH